MRKALVEMKMESESRVKFASRRSLFNDFNRLIIIE